MTSVRNIQHAMESRAHANANSASSMPPDVSLHHKPQRPATLADPAFRDFDRLPTAACVGVAVVAALQGCSISSVWKRVKAGRFPPPIDRGTPGTKASWQVGVVREALAGRWTAPK